MTDKHNFVSPKYNTLLSVIAMLVITTIVLAWSASSREKEFLQSQQNLAENSVSGVANQISNKISDLRQGIKLFAEKEQQLLRKIVDQPDNLDAYDHLVEITKKEFPNAVAITIADKNGDPFIEDFDGFILDICRRDIKSFSKTRHPPEVFIHPNPLAYHIDIMVKVNIGLGEQTIFFVSFSPDLISRILNNGELYSHKLLLLKNDDSGLIEINSKGARDIMSVDNLHLPKEEIEKIIYSRPVTHTAWKLVDLPVNDYLSKHCREIWNETIFILSLLFTFSFLMVYIQSRAEKKAQRKTEIAIKEKLAAEGASKAKTNFLANMSHEIRTPLTAIIGYGETLLNSEQSEKERINAVNTVISSGEHLLSLINDILDVSKIEAEKLAVENEKVSPFRVLSEVESIIAGHAKNKGVDFSIDYEFPLPAEINSDQIRLKQILLNLCSNAVKFTSKGYIRIAVRYEQPVNSLYFVVQDSGIGIAEDNVNSVFASFTQADSSTTRKYGGTGLGLTLSKQLACLLGGDIDVASKLGIGSTFALHVPTNVNEQIKLIYDETEIPKFDIESNKKPVYEKLSGKVLVAEDNINNQNLIKHHLERMGLTVSTVNNGKRAIDMALEQNFDLIFMDIQMPVIGGLEAIEMLRNRGYKKPIVALTANALQEDKDVCMVVGCTEYATKPIHYEQLYLISRKYVSVEKNSLIETPLHSTLSNNEKEYQEILSTFIAGLDPTMEKLEAAYEQQEWEFLSDHIHQLKGVGGGYGYPDITKLAAKIELQIMNKNYDEVSSLLDELRKLIARIVLGHHENISNARNAAGI